MANAFSKQLSYNPDLQLTNMAQYTGAIQGAMQQKFDLNLAKIDDLIGKVTAIPLVRDKDKQYLGERLQTLVSTVDSTLKLDLTDTTATAQINNYISTAVDDNVKNQLANSQQIYNFNDTVKSMQKKDSKTYNQDNVEYSRYKAGYDKYMKGESDELGNLEYIPYTDKNKVLDELKKIKDLKGDQVLEIPDPVNPGRILKKTVKGLSADEIFQYMPDLMSSQVKKQLAIDGWAKYRNDPQEAERIFKITTDKKLDVLKNTVDLYEAASNNPALTPAERNEALSKYKKQKENYVSYKSSIQNIDTKNVEQIGYLLEQDSYQTSVAKIASGRTSEEYKADPYYFAMANLDIANKKLNIAEQKLELDKQKAADDEKKSLLEPWVASPAESGQAKSLDALKDMNKQYIGIHDSVIEDVAKVYNRPDIPEETKRQFRKILADKGFAYKDGKLMYAEGAENKAKNFSRVSVITEAFTQSGMARLDADTAKEVVRLETNARALVNPIAEANKASYVEVFNKDGDADRYIEDLKTAYKNTKFANPGDIAYSLISDPASMGVRAAQGAGLGFLAAGPIGALALGAAGAVGEAVRNAPIHIAKVRKVGDKIEKYVNENGGWEKLKDNIKNDPIKLKQYMDLMEEAKDTSAELNENFTSYKEKVTTGANDYLVKLNKEGRGASFNALSEFNITDKKIRDSVINLMSQTKDNLSAEFSADKPITVSITSDGSVVVKQNKGVGTKDGNPFVKMPAVYEAPKGSALYNFVTQNIDIDQSKRGLNATVSGGTVIKPYVKPSYISSNDSEQIGVAQKSFTQLPLALRNAMTDNPENYIDEVSTREVFHRRLKGVMPEDQIDVLLNQLEDNLEHFDVKIRPINGAWGQTITNNLNGFKLINGKLDNNPYLDPSILHLTTMYPQVLISDSVLRMALNNPKNVFQIFQNQAQ